ncbi:PASTA domain-containing protein [Actinoplanes sp. NPDC051343]|uniref:caspase, EACC1-associated type n=1 Tax=Actinoplanes sp. NPDC051343 TaxID=3363906 RepID=UPI0037982F43
MTYRALLIGNSVFEADAGLNPLNAPTKDVARLHRALVDSATGLFAEENVRLVIERSSHDLLDELDRFFSEAHRDDLLLLYYSGHGLLDERNQLFLCGRNTRSDRLLRTAVSNVRINEFIEQAVARCTVIILDCCSSGMFKGGDVAAPLAGPGRYVVSSTRGAALANDAAVATGTSLFTEHLVTGLLGAADDRDGDGYLDLREVFDYVRAKLSATTKQIPHCRFDGDAAVMLAKRPAAPAPAATAAARRAGDPTFVLSENTVTLRDVGPDERLGPEVIEIFPLADAEVDCTAETDAAWLDAEVRGGQLTIELRPHPGPNRGKIVVRDRRSGTAQVVRVHVTVDRRSAGAQPAIADSPSQPTPADGAGQTGIAAEPPPTRTLARVRMPHAVPPPDKPDAGDSPGPDAGGRGGKRRWLVGLAAAAVLLAAGAAALLFPAGRSHTPIPALVGLTRADAEATLHAKGLTATAVPAPFGSTCAPDAVVAQNPPAGQPADRGIPISITVCNTTPSAPAPTAPHSTGSTRGPKLVGLPDLGETCGSADQALRKVNLSTRCVPKDSASSAGRVVGSNPRHEAPTGSTVDVFISNGSLCRVPDVQGLSTEAADEQLKRHQLESQIREEPSDEAPGTVIKQSRSPEDEVKCGTSVTLTVATTPPSPVTDPTASNNGG